MKPSLALASNRDAIRRVVAAHRASNPRVFGSVAHGDDTEESDLDILIDPTPETSLFDIGAIRHELLQLLGVPIDAPGFVPDGAMRGAEFGGFSGVVRRGGWFGGVPMGGGPFARRRWWHQITGAWCLTAGWGATDGELRGGFDGDGGGCLDAPEYLAAGGCLGGSVRESDALPMGIILRRGAL